MNKLKLIAFIITKVIFTLNLVSPNLQKARAQIWEPDWASTNCHIFIDRTGTIPIASICPTKKTTECKQIQSEPYPHKLVCSDNINLQPPSPENSIFTIKLHEMQKKMIVTLETQPNNINARLYDLNELFVSHNFSNNQQCQMKSNEDNFQQYILSYCPKDYMLGISGDPTRSGRIYYKVKFIPELNGI